MERLKKINRKTWALLLVIAMMATLLLGVGFHVEAESVFAGGDGSESNPYIISTAEQLNEVRNHLDAYYIQVSDIDLSDYKGWVPIGSAEVPFTGGYDGGTHVINMLTLNGDSISAHADLNQSNCRGVGLFGFIEDSSISNISIANFCAFVTSTHSYESIALGPIAGKADDSTIQNCSVKGIIMDSAVPYFCFQTIGGIVGCAYGSEGLIKDCVSEVSFNGAFRPSGSPLSYSWLKYDIGGIAGEASRVDSCINKGIISCDINADCEGFTNRYRLGGITGVCERPTIINCDNYGDVKASFNSMTDSLAYVGGITGQIDAAGAVYSCNNYGNIKSIFDGNTDEKDDGACCAGGIAGYIDSTITQSFNHSKEIQSFSRGNIGRIVGFDNGSGNLENNYSSGETLLNGEKPIDNIGLDKKNGATIDTESIPDEEYYLRCLDANIELTLDGVYDDEHYQLKPEFLPKLAEGENLKYESSDLNVLTVTSTGLVEAKTEGEATITITHPVTKQSTSVKFTVLDGPRVVLASEIPLSGMGVGQSSTVYAQVKSGRQYLKDNVAFSIANSNPSVVSISNVKNKTGITSFEIKALKEGEAIITVSDSGSGALYSKHITVTSGVKSYNAASLPINYEDLTNKEFRVAINGMIVDEYEMEDLGKNWKVSFNVYNQMCHAGVVEVYNEDGSLKEYVPIKRFDGGYVTSLWGTLETICDMAKDLVDRNTLSYKDSTCSHKTEVSIDVPKGGKVVLTNDPLYSKSCAVVNMADFCTEVLLRGVSLIDKINKDDVTKSVFDVTKQKSLKLLKEEYLHGGATMYKLGESVQDSFKSIVGQKALENLSEDALKKLFVETDQAFRRFDIDFSEIIADILNVKTGLKYGVDTIQSELIANADIFGLTLEIAFNAQKDLSILNYYIDLQKEYSNHAICIYFDAADNSLYSSDGVSAKSLSGNNTLSQKNFVLHSYVLSNNEELDNKQRRALDEKSDKYVVRNIYLERDGVVSQPGEVVEVTVPVPDSYDINKCNIYWIKDDGSLAKMNSTVDGHNLVFQTTHFSLYAVVEETSSLPDSFEVLLPSDFEMSVGDTIPMFIDQLEGKYELFNYNHEFKETDTAKRANKFVSKDESIVTVDEKGNVTAHKAGTTTIIGSYGNKTAECKVTVGYPWAGYGTVSKVSLNRVSINGKTYELNLSDNSEDILYYEKTTQRALMDYIYAYKLDEKGRIVELKHPSVNGYWKLLGSRDGESYYYEVADSICLDYPLVEKSEVDKYIGDYARQYYVTSKYGYISIAHTIHVQKNETDSDPYLNFARFVPDANHLDQVKDTFKLAITDNEFEQGDLFVYYFPEVKPQEGETFQELAERLPVLSSNEAVAKVVWENLDDIYKARCYVKAVNAGEATLTFINPTTGMSCSAKVVVTDKRSDAGKVETVALDRTSVTFTVGDSVPLAPTAKNPYGGTVTAVYDWSSSDSSVVTVDKDGIAKAVKPGKASVTATEKSTGKTATCEFVVEEGEDTVVVIKTPTTEVSVAQGRSQTVSVTLLNRNAVILNKPVVWASEDESVATVNQNGVITGKSPGTTHVTASVDGQSLVIPVTVTERQSIFTAFADIIKVVTNRLQESFNRRLQRQQAIRDLIKSIVTRQ